MIGELIVHLGDTKTGSTSIQNVLVQKAYDVSGTRILYPAKTHHNGLVRTLLRRQKAKQRAARFGHLYNRLCDSTADYGIVSAEHFQFVDPKLFNKMVKAHWPQMADRMRLVAYVRPHHEKLLSSFSERVKLGQVTGSFEAFCDDMSNGKVLDYLPRFRKWRAVFGDRFELRPFVRQELYRSDVVSDFFHTMLGHEAFTTQELSEVNQALTLPQLALVRQVHVTLADRLQARQIQRSPERSDARSMLGRMVGERLQSIGLGQEGSRFRMPAEMTDRILQRYEKDAAGVDAEFFAGAPLSQALSRIEQKATTDIQSLESADHFSEETRMAVQGFASLLADMLIDEPKKFQKMAARTRTVFSNAG